MLENGLLFVDQMLDSIGWVVFFCALPDVKLCLRIWVHSVEALFNYLGCASLGPA